VAGENAEAFRKLAGAMRVGDGDALVAGTHPDAEAVTLRSAVQGAFRGHEGVREFVRDNRENFEVFEPRYEEIEEAPDGRVLATGTLHLRGRGSGIETEFPIAAVVEFRDGLMYRYRDYGDADSARAALG
jgi:ketosteroid isomerase-like protein